MQHKIPKLNDPSLLKKDVAYINGEWVAARSGKTFEVNGECFREILTSSGSNANMKQTRQWGS